MGFFNSLSQIHKNSNHFAEWEKEQQIKQSQREVLYTKKEYTEKELNSAKQYGKTIMNAIDVMDNHSENVAENVETALQPVVALTPVLATAGTFFLSAKYIIDPARNKIIEETNNILNTDGAKKLAENIRNTEKLYQSPERIFTSKKKIAKIENADLRRQAEVYLDKIVSATKSTKYKRNIGIALIPISLILSHFGINVWAAKLQVGSSKVARFQARQSLEDPKAFVEYTPEQIERAKQEIADNPQLKKHKNKQNKKLRQGMVGSIFGVFRDNRAYRRDKKADKDESKLVTRPLTQEETEQAERDKEVIQRTVRLINNEAEKYSENMEVAAGVLIGGTPFLGAAVGGLTAWICNKTGVIKKVVDKNVNKDASEGTLKLYNELLDTQKEKKTSITRKIKIIEKWSDFYNSLREDVINKFSDSSNKKDMLPLKKEVKTLFMSLMAHNKVGGWVIAGAGALFTGIVGALIGLKLQKSSARAGRYTAKRELEKDPRNFIGYTEQDYEEVKDVEDTQQKTSKFKEYALFIPTVLKQYFAYNKYKKHEFKENQLLQEQLQKQDVSEKQISDAKNLQRKIFNTFEKVDDNSQQYSESMEAAIEIAQPYVAYGGIALLLSPLAIIASLSAKGKISTAKLIEKLSGMFAKSSKLAKSKFAKKYLKGVQENIDYTVKHTDVEIKPLGALIGGTNLYEGSIIENCKTLVNNIDVFPNVINNYSESQIRNYVLNIKSALLEHGVPGDSELIEILNKIINDKNLKKCIQESLKPLSDQLNNLYKLKSKMSSVDFESIKNITGAVENLSVKDILKFSKSIINLVAGGKYNIENVTARFKADIEKMSKEEFEQFIYRNSTLRRLGKMDQKMLIKTIENAEKMLKNMPKEELKGILEQCVKTFNENPDEFIKLLQSGEIASVLRTPGLEKALVAAGISWTAFTLILTYVIESWLADLQLKAGRLGVMKSLEDLDDVRYYANIE